MNTNSTIETKAKISAFFNRPSVQIASQVLAGLTLAAAGAFFGYRSGKKAGEQGGQVKGYAAALGDIGVSPAEVPDLASAWAQTKIEAERALSMAMTPAT